MSKLLVLYYSSHGHIEQMAEAIAAWKDKREGEFAPLAPIPRI